MMTVTCIVDINLVDPNPVLPCPSLSLTLSLTRTLTLTLTAGGDQRAGGQPRALLGLYRGGWG